MPEGASTRHYANGHLSPDAGSFDDNAIAPSSESDLSEAIDPPKPTSPSSQGLDDSSEHEDNCRHNSLSSQDEDAIGSDDGDYEMDSPLPPAIQVTRDDRSSSQESRRPAKRKAGLEIEEDILNNPELYGIRRSVCLSLLYHGPLTDISRLVPVPHTVSYVKQKALVRVLLTWYVQIESASEDDGSDSDIQANPRKRRKQTTQHGKSAINPYSR
jgi:hypothetical protein